jgi:hypothetical protein
MDAAVLGPLGEGFRLRVIGTTALFALLLPLVGD